jgi:hypothetical protein
LKDSTYPLNVTVDAGSVSVTSKVFSFVMVTGSKVCVTTGSVRSAVIVTAGGVT